MNFSLNFEEYQEIGGLLFLPDESMKKEYKEVEKLTRYFRKKVIHKILHGENLMRWDDYDLLNVYRKQLKWNVAICRFRMEINLQNRIKSRNKIKTILSSFFVHESIFDDVFSYMTIQDFYVDENDKTDEKYLIENKNLCRNYHIYLRDISNPISWIVYRYIFSTEYRKLQWKYEHKRQELRNIIQYFVCKDLHYRNIFEHHQIMVKNLRKYSYIEDYDDDF